METIGGFNKDKNKYIPIVEGIGGVCLKIISDLRHQ